MVVETNFSVKLGLKLNNYKKKLWRGRATREGGLRGWGRVPKAAGSRLGGDNSKRAHSAQRRVGPKA